MAEKASKGLFDRFSDIADSVGGGFGEGLSTVAGGLDDFFGEADEWATPAAKGIVRTGLMSLESFGQELSTFYRYGASSLSQGKWSSYQPYGSSFLREAIWDSPDASNRGGGGGFQWDVKNQGSGWMPSEEAREVIDKKALYFSIDGGKGTSFGGYEGNDAVTLGRMVASHLFEPEHAGYQILSGVLDMAVSVLSDPATVGLGAAKKAGLGARAVRASRSVRDGDPIRGLAQLGTNPYLTPPRVPGIQSAAASALGSRLGLKPALRGGRNSFDPEKGEGWLRNSLEGKRIVELLRDADSRYDILHATGGRIPVQLVDKLAKAATDDEVLEVFLGGPVPILGGTVRTLPEFSSYKVKAAHRSGSRLFQGMPNPMIDPDDADGVVKTAENVLRNAKVLPELRETWVNRLIETVSATGIDRKAVIQADLDEMMADVATDLVTRARGGGIRVRKVPGMLDHDALALRARELTQMFNQNFDLERKYFIDELAANKSVKGLKIGGILVPKMESPYLQVEYLNNMIPMPGARELRRATSVLAPMIDNPFYDNLADKMDMFQSVWKRTVLLRGAYTVRVIGEEQLRMAAAGYESLVNHPISFLSALIADPAKISRKTMRQAEAAGDAAHEAFLAATAAEELATPGMIPHKRVSGVAGPSKAWDEAYNKVIDDYRKSKSLAAPRGGAGRFLPGSTLQTDFNGQYFHDGGLMSPEMRRSQNEGWAGNEEMNGKIDSGQMVIHRRPKDAEERAGESMDAALDEGASLEEGTEVYEEALALGGEGRNRQAYMEAWADGIVKSAEDPLLSRLAGKPGLHGDETVERASETLDEVAQAYMDPEGDLAWIRETNLRKGVHGPNRQAVDSYIKEIHDGLVFRLGGNPGGLLADGTTALSRPHSQMLQNLVAGGPLPNGKPLVTYSKSGKAAINDDLRASLRVALTEGHAPDFVVGPRQIKGVGVTATTKITYDHVTGWMFSILNTRPTNYLSRSPVFRQAYWARIEEMIPWMNVGDRAQLLKSAAGNVNERTSKRLTSLVRDMPLPKPKSVTVQAGDLSAGKVDWDGLAKAHALTTVKDLLYDASQRSQFFDSFRLVFPFGEAWREVMTRWIKMSVENPMVPYRGNQIIEGARGNGFFHKDSNGQEVFSYPFSSQLVKLFTGIPGTPLKGSVSGLSFSTDVLPGVGPVMQVAAAAIIPETPNWDWIKKAVSPYGEADYSGGILEAFAPAYLKKGMMAAGVGDDRIMGNAINEAQSHLVGLGDRAPGGRYDLSNLEDRDRLSADATKLAKQIYTLRMITQFGSPSPPTPTFLATLPNGEQVAQYALAKDFQRLQTDPSEGRGGVGYDAAVYEFLERYGTDNFLIMQSKSQSLVYESPTTDESSNWERKNPSLVKDYGEVWGMFAEKGDPTKFNHQAYRRQFVRGDRVALTPEQFLAMGEGRIGWRIHDEMKSKLPPNPSRAQLEWFKQIKERITEEYPGFGTQYRGLPQRADQEFVMAELKRAAKDPRLSSNPISSPTLQYMKARDRALAEARRRGFTTLDSASVRDLREWLAGVGSQLRSRHPKFQPVFERVFSREVEG